MKVWHIFLLVSMVVGINLLVCGPSAATLDLIMMVIPLPLHS